MKRIISLSILLLFALGSVLADSGLSEADRAKIIEEIRNELPVRFSLYANGIYAPFLYRGYGDLSPEGLTQHPDFTERSPAWGPAYGAGSGGGANYGALMGFEMWGRDRTDRFGVNLNINASSNRGGGINLSGNDLTANLWAKPFGDIFEMYMGLYFWDELQNRREGADRFMVERGYIRENDMTEGMGAVMGNYGNTAVFDRVESANTLGLLLLFAPPSTVPDWARGFKAFINLGSSGGIDPAFNRFRDFGANTKNNWKHVFTRPHVGIAYSHDAFGMVRFQFMGSNYLYGEGLDRRFDGQQSPWIFLPRNVGASPRVQGALNITAIPNVFIDVGISYPFPVTVKYQDTGEKEAGVTNNKLGPAWLDIGWRGKETMQHINRAHMADNPGDIWYALKRISADIDIKGTGFGLPAFNLRLSGFFEFGGGVAFETGAESYQMGNRFHIGVQPQYDFDRVGLFTANVSLRLQQNDKFPGNADKPWDISGQLLTPSELNIARNSFNHNGIIDLGIGAFFTRQITPGAKFKTGIAMTIPVGGDRYTWSNDNIGSELGLSQEDAVFFSSDVTERVKQGNMLIAIPFIFNMRY